MDDSFGDIVAIILITLFSFWIFGAGSSNAVNNIPVSHAQESKPQWQQVDDYAKHLEQRAASAERYFK